MSTRRQFIRWAGAALGCSGLAGLEADAEAAGLAAAAEQGPATARGSPPARTGADIGSLFPFVQSQAAHSSFSLSFLRADFKDLHAWKRQARGKLLELLELLELLAELLEVLRSAKAELLEEKIQGVLLAKCCSSLDGYRNSLPHLLHIRPLLDRLLTSFFL